MRFHVGYQLRQPVGTEVAYDIQEAKLFLDDDAILSDLAGTVVLLRTDKGLLVTVRATCTAREICSRCLAETDCTIEIDFQEEFIPLSDPLTGAPIRLGDDDDRFRIDREFVLDLGEALRQYRLMSEPLKPLCSPHCAGLCPRCGKNLNEGPCLCPPEVDERWQALARLKGSLDEQGG